MESPFLDIPEVKFKNSHSSFRYNSELESKSPFVENILENTKSETDTETVDFESDLHDKLNSEFEYDILPESEISNSDLLKATSWNKKYMDVFGWRPYSKKMLPLIDADPSNFPDIDKDLDAFIKAFTLAFANWQEKKGFTTSYKGVFGINNWTYFQKKLGFHNLNNKYNINANKAISDNKYYASRTWKNEKQNIYKLFASLGIVKVPLALSDEYFAYGVAYFQALKGLNVDGILGPNTWAKMQASTQGGAPSTSQPQQGTPILSRWHDVVKGAVPCNAEPLVDGTESFIRINEAIRAVKPGGFIYILGWMLDIDFVLPAKKGEAPASLYDLLNEAAAIKGIEIRILIWKNPFYITEINHAQQRINLIKGNVKCFIDDATFGSPVVHAALLALRSGISTLPTVVSLGLQYFNSWKEFVRYTNQQNEGSHHEKILITGDAEKLTAFCGGVDINPDRINVLHDTHCRLEGYAAWELWNRFVQRWKAYLLSRGMTNAAGVDLLKGNKISPPPPLAPGATVAYAKVLHTYNHWNGQANDRSIRNTLREVIRNAQRYVYFEDQYMVSCEIAGWLNERLVNVPGFRVIIITQDDENAQSDLRFAKRKRAEFLAKLKDNIPDLTKVQVKQLSNKSAPGIHRKIHSKIYVVDGELMIIGSANCNRRSMFNDSETAVFLFKHETSGYDFITLWNSKLAAFDPQKALIDYIKNPDPSFDDIDRKIYNEIKNASPYLAVINPAIALLAKMNLDPLLRPLFEKFWEVIDPNPDNISCPLPSFISSEYEELKEIIQPENFTEIPVYENLLPSAGILKLSPRTATFLSPEKNAAATKYNITQVQKSGIALTDILNLLGNHFDLGIIEAALTDMNNNSTGSKFNISAAPGTVVDAVFTEALHQFQISNYADPRDQDAVLGQSSLETLGFFENKFRTTARHLSTYATVLRNNNSGITTATGGEFNATNWFNYIVKPAWLGIKLSTGVHLLLYRKLKEAQDWLLAQPQYRGLTAAEVGQKLGITNVTGSRSLQNDQAMHAYGLAIDIDSDKNPWIGAGWIKYDKVKLTERTRMLDVFKKTSGQNLSGSTVFSYLDSIAANQGMDTSIAYNTLKQRHDEFVSYLGQHASELSFWRNSATFGNGVAANGFLHLHADLVYALRQIAGLAWGAMDFGPRASGDIMHFDLRTIGVGKLLCEKIGGFVPTTGHPAITNEVFSDEIMYDQFADQEFTNEPEFDESETVDEQTEFAREKYTDEEEYRYQQYSSNIPKEVTSSPSPNFNLKTFETENEINSIGSGSVLKSPFLDVPLNEDFLVSSSKIHEQNGEESYIQEGHEENQLDNFIEGEELTSSELDAAIPKNKVFMKELKWENYLDKIFSVLNLSFPRQNWNDLYGPAFAKAVAKFQELPAYGLKPSYKGALGLGTWSVMQGAIGLHEFDLYNYIDIEKAKKENELKEKKGTWKPLDRTKILNLLGHNLPLDSKYFSLAVAKFQKLSALPVNGILDTTTFSRLIKSDAITNDTPINLDVEDYNDPNNSGIPLTKITDINRKQHLSENFTVEEFARAGEGKYKWEYYRVDPNIITELQVLRNDLKKSITIIDGYYPPKYEKLIGRKLLPNDPHFSGRGIKIKVKGMSGKQLAERIILDCDPELSISFGDLSASFYIAQNLPRLSSYIKDETKRKDAIRYLEGIIRGTKGAIVENFGLPSEILPPALFKLSAPLNDIRNHAVLKTHITDAHNSIDKFLKAKTASLAIAGLGDEYLEKMSSLIKAFDFMEDISTLATIAEKKKKYKEFLKTDTGATVFATGDILEGISKLTHFTIKIGFKIAIGLTTTSIIKESLIKKSEAFEKILKPVAIAFEGVKIIKSLAGIIINISKGNVRDVLTGIEDIGSSLATIYAILKNASIPLAIATAGYQLLKLVWVEIPSMVMNNVRRLAMEEVTSIINALDREFKPITAAYLIANNDYERILELVHDDEQKILANEGLQTRAYSKFIELHTLLDKFYEYMTKFSVKIRDRFSKASTISMYDNFIFLKDYKTRSADYDRTYTTVLNEFYTFCYEGIVRCQLEISQIYEERLKEAGYGNNEIYNDYTASKNHHHHELLSEADFVSENATHEEPESYVYVSEEEQSDNENIYDEMSSDIDQNKTEFNNKDFEEEDPYQNVRVEQEDFNNDYSANDSYDHLHDMQIAEVIEHQVAVANSSNTTAKPCEGRTCWAKEVLNKELGLSLSLNNTFNEETKKAISNFQSKNNLAQTSKIDPATERALLEADAIRRHNGTAYEQTSLNTITTARTKIEDFTKQAINTKPQYILESYRDPRKVYAFVLHHMAFKRKGRVTKQYSDPTSYLSTGAHFCIMLNGRIIQLHAMSRMIWHGNCISPRSVAVEFEGNFPDVKGKWWINRKSSIQNKDNPTQAQFDSGRFLAGYLKIVLGTTHILAHRQSSDSRENDPGPDIWYNVGQWAIEKLGMLDGGSNFKCGTGNPILPQWRTWGNKTSSTEVQEYSENLKEAEATDNFQNKNDETSEENYTNDEDYTADIEQQVKDWQNAIKLNRSYAAKLGWQQYYDQINDLLLPFSGQTAVSLGEEEFARAVEAWQNANGFTGSDADGVLGPHTWAVMSKSLHKGNSLPASIPAAPVITGSSDEKIIDGVRFKKKNYGWAAYGGGNLKSRLQDMKQKGLLTISQNEIEMFGLISIPESGGLVNAINSWDSAYMSMGFIQFTIKYYELQEVIKKAPEAFKKHDIELDYSNLYFKDEKRSVAIKNAPSIVDLRKLEWAVRFFRAGLEDDVITAQINVAREILQDLRRRYDAEGYLNRFNNSYPNVWAFIYESNNSRPAVLHVALKSAVLRANGLNIYDPIQFGKLLIEELNTATYNYYSSNVKYKSEEEKTERVKAELEKVKRVIQKTGITK